MLSHLKLVSVTGDQKELIPETVGPFDINRLLTSGKNHHYPLQGCRVGEESWVTLAASPRLWCQEGERGPSLDLRQTSAFSYLLKEAWGRAPQGLAPV